MTQDEIISLAREAGYDPVSETLPHFHGFIELFAALVAENTSIEQQREIVRLKSIIEEQANGAQNLVLAERELCAQVCEVQQHSWNNAVQCAAAIRQRGSKS